MPYILRKLVRVKSPKGSVVFYVSIPAEFKKYYEKEERVAVKLIDPDKGIIYIAPASHAPELDKISDL